MTGGLDKRGATEFDSYDSLYTQNPGKIPTNGHYIANDLGIMESDIDNYIN
jgi:hypothetical protein